MRGKPNEERPAVPVSPGFVPAGGVKHSVRNGETWKSLAASLGIDPWDLIEFNFPGTKNVKLLSSEKASRQVNWYLREYVGCVTTNDGENLAFTSGLTKGLGAWKAGHIFLPPKPAPTPVLPPISVRPQCSPTGGSWRRPTFYRPLNDKEQAMARRVFGNTLPSFDTIGIGNGLGAQGRPWTDMGPGRYSQMPYMNFEINMGDAANQDLTSNAHTNCFVQNSPGTLSELLIHELTHVWQYHNSHWRVGVWISSVFGSYSFTPGDPWEDYDVEQQASLVEEWFHNGATKTDPLYPYIRLVIRSGRLEFPRTLTLKHLANDVADLRSRGLD